MKGRHGGAKPTDRNFATICAIGDEIIDLSTPKSNTGTLWLEQRTMPERARCTRYRGSWFRLVILGPRHDGILFIGEEKPAG
jgi:hypothetical protein